MIEYDNSMRTEMMISLKASSEKGQHSKAMKVAAAIDGVVSVTVSGEGRSLLRVVGEGVDSNDLISKLRRKVGHADIVELRTLQAGRGYATTAGNGRGDYHSAHAVARGHAVYDQYSSYPAISYNNNYSPAAADQYYRHHQPSYEYCQPAPPYATTGMLHEYPNEDSAGCSIM